MLLNYSVGEDSWESFGQQEIQPVHPKGNQSWVFIGRTDVEAETPIFWPPGAKSWLIRKEPKAGKDWRQEEKGTTEDKMVGWHNQLNGHEFELAPGVGDGQGSLVCCSPWGRSQTQLSDWTELNYLICYCSQMAKSFESALHRAYYIVKNQKISTVVQSLLLLYSLPADVKLETHLWNHR